MYACIYILITKFVHTQNCSSRSSPSSPFSFSPAFSICVLREFFFSRDTLLIVSDTAIDDLNAYLVLNRVEHFGFETTEVVTSAELEAYDFGAAAQGAAMADLFGLI